MKTFTISLILLIFLAWSRTVGFAADSAAGAPPPKDPSLEQRVADLEAYLNNVGRAADTPTNNVKSNVGVAGPGHNGWMMTSSALVLFMTLPGLALFYGGLVRRKNVLSVLAQCLGLAGLVTILWWLCGYSLVFGDVGGAGGDRATFLGSFAHVFLNVF
jgi:Amt family ammonium transporter